MQIPFQRKKISIYYDSKTYAPTSHTTLLFINTVRVTSSDQTGAMIGVGSGLDAIALVLKGLRNVIATDIDPHSLSIAKQNVEANKVKGVIEVRKGSLFDPLSDVKKNGGIDVLYVSPPCMPIPPDQINQFPSSVNGGPDRTKYLEIALKRHLIICTKSEGDCILILHQRLTRKNFSNCWIRITPGKNWHELKCLFQSSFCLSGPS